MAALGDATDFPNQLQTLARRNVWRVWPSNSTQSAEATIERRKAAARLKTLKAISPRRFESYGKADTPCEGLPSRWAETQAILLKARIAALRPA
jgi:hypothetical protein